MTTSVEQKHPIRIFGREALDEATLQRLLLASKRQGLGKRKRNQSKARQVKEEDLCLVPLKHGQKRERQLPWLPQPYECTDEGVRHLKEISSDQLEEFKKGWCPNNNTEEYLKQLSETAQKSLRSRAEQLVRHTRSNFADCVSEFAWEGDYFRDVFGPMRDDSKLYMDKRPYDHPDLGEDGNPIAGRRIPDLTMGLRSHNWCRDGRLEGRYPDKLAGDSDQPAPNPTLSTCRMEAMMKQPQCALVVDGTWGATDMIFPFAVYEAKKAPGKSGDYPATDPRPASLRKDNPSLHARAQVLHALCTYLAMLDDLARDPNNVSKYQTPESKHVRVFGFTSQGSWWNVYVAYEYEGNISMHRLFRGDVANLEPAIELLCLVDQIHEYGANHHRDFVIKHLEPWLAIAPQQQEWSDALEGLFSTLRKKKIVSRELLAPRGPWDSYARWRRLKRDSAYRKPASKKRKSGTGTERG